VLGALIPAGITLGVAYTQNRRALEAKISQDLSSESTQTARAISVWLKERLYDLRVFASSDEVSTNLNRYATQGLASPRLREYLRSLHERFTDFEQIIVLDANGRVLATSAQQATTVRLPTDWQKTLRQQGQVVGDAYWDSRTSRGKLIVAVPISRADGRLIGAFAAEINLAPVQALLNAYSRDSLVGGVYLAAETGALIASAREISDRLLKSSLKEGTFRRLARSEGATVTYTNFDGREVVGTLKKVPQTGWSVVAEISADAAFDQVRRFRNGALLVVLLVLLVVAATAYRLGLIIVRPLERLAEGAAEVAMGDLDVDLTDTGAAGEVGALTGVFNHMVSRLRAGRSQLASANETLRQKNAELEQLSVTDGLTGLVNHRALMQRLMEESLRSQRNKRAFAVIMTDVDHFKTYNDEFGHPAGDEVLKKVSLVLRECTRTVDCVARYGGEEFAVLLPETEMSGALEVAERIRSRVEGAEFPGRRITLSIGVAEFPTDADTAPGIIAIADKALYVAKREGRNQVAQAKQAAKKQKLPAPRAPRKNNGAKKKS
jgi:diguanylate cyclase (GGDEF)-like protein